MGHVRIAISRQGSVDFEKVYSFEKGDSSPLFVTLQTILLLEPENGAEVDKP